MGESESVRRHRGSTPAGGGIAGSERPGGTHPAPSFGLSLLEHPDHLRFAESAPLERSSPAAEDTLLGIEGVVGGSGNDRLNGDDNANLLDGGEGAD